MRKARSLIKAGATVKLIDPAEPATKIPKGLELITREYCSDDFCGAAVVFACTNDRETNARIANDARAAGALVNAADQNDDCDFYLPAVHSQGNITVTVSSGGIAPGLTGMLRDKLADALPEKIDEFAEALSKIRTELKKTLPESQRCKIAKQLAAQTGYETFVARGISGLYELAKKMINLQEKF